VIGWYGKIPQRGDFIVRRLPASFREPWDRWLQSAMAGSRERLGEHWRDAYLSMPAWRFALEPGVLSSQGWAGVMIPSADSVGRYFPLTVAAALPPAPLDPVARLLAAAAWLDALEAIALSALDPGTEAEAIDTAILQQPFHAEAAAPPRPQAHWVAPGTSAPRAAWLSSASELFSRSLALSAELPAPQQYCAMMDGRWAAHGWKARPGP
jgi:type VI secretion system protein ImpM